MNPILIGSGGMLGSDINNVLAHSYSKFTSIQNSSRLEISDRESVRKVLLLEKSRGRDSVINCAACTDVSGIEINSTLSERSFRSNVLGPRYLAEACEDLGLRLVHFSTDYVYSQHSLGTKIFQDEFPVNLYGTHKLLGEEYVKNTMRSGNYAIIRIGCLYGIANEKSFVHKFLRNASSAKAAGKDSVDVIDFQLSTPTPTGYVASSFGTFLENRDFSGTFSISPSGSATRFEFAKKILSELENAGISSLSEMKVNPIYPKDALSIPEISTLDAMNRTTHVGNDVPWDACLKFFIYENKESLSSFIDGCLDGSENSRGIHR